MVLVPFAETKGTRRAGAKARIIILVCWGIIRCRVSPLQTRHFCFGNSAQNHFRPCAALWVPPPPYRIKMARELAPLKQPSPRGRFGTEAPPRTKAGTPIPKVKTKTLFPKASDPPSIPNFPIWKHHNSDNQTSDVYTEGLSLS